MSERSLLRLNDGVLLYTETTAYNSDVMCACALNIYCYDRYTLFFDDWSGLDWTVTFVLRRQTGCKGWHPTLLFVLLVFNDTFSTNRLYRVIGV